MPDHEELQKRIAAKHNDRQTLITNQIHFLTMTGKVTACGRLPDLVNWTTEEENLTSCPACLGALAARKPGATRKT